MIYNIYLVCAEIGEERLYKIGYTKRPIEKRIKELKTGNPDLELIWTCKAFDTKIENNEIII